MAVNSNDTIQKNVANKKKKKNPAIKIIITVVVIVLVSALILNMCGFFNTGFGKNGKASAQTLTTYTVGTRAITQILTSSGTIEPNDQYTINALVSGEILEEYFDEGDTVTEDQLLFKVDSENMESGITRAENSLKNANKSLEKGLENLENLNIESDYMGTVTKIYIEEGDEVSQGAVIADVVDDATMLIDVPFMYVDIKNINVGDAATITFSSYETANGIVKKIGTSPSINSNGVEIRYVEISVKNTGSIRAGDKAFANIGDIYCTSDAAFYYNDEGTIKAKASGDVDAIFFDEGDVIRKGQYFARLESEDLEEQIENLRDAVKEAQDSLEDARDSYDNYNIKAPITGTVISKNYKVGDTIGSSQQGAATLAVIYDMSALKFSMSIDELDIDKLSKGQEVIITSEARDGKEYIGKVTNISIQGSTSSGTTVYPVEVTIENTEDESKRTTAQDGTINKVYMTGMTSTEKTYSLISAQNTGEGIAYTYDNGIIITKQGDNLYDNGELLNVYLDGKYTRGSNFYNFSPDFTTLTLEIQDSKQMLRPGMNIDAQIIVAEAESAISVPIDAVGRGNIVKVLKNPEAASQNNDNKEKSDKKQQESLKSTENTGLPKGMELPENMELPEDMELPEGMEMPSDFQMPEGMERPEGMPSFNTNSGSYGTVNADAEYEEIRVTIGLDDGDFVEITSGLEIGDVVIVESRQSSGNDYIMMGGMTMPMGNMGGGMPSGGMPSGMGGGMPSGGMGGGPGGMRG